MSTLAGPLYVDGQLSAESIILPDDTVGNAAVGTLSPIGAEKLQHQYAVTLALCNHATDFAGPDRRALHKVYGAAGTVLAFSAWSTVLAGATTTVTVDLLKNGTTILTSTITLDSTNTIYVAEDAVISSAAVVAGDVLECNATISGTNEPKGVAVRLVWREDATP